MANAHKPAAPARSALLILDMISDFEFEDGAALCRRAASIAPRIARLKKRLKAAGVRTIYVNDERGDWNANRDELLRHCLASKSRGRAIAEVLTPEHRDLFIFKPRHSGFYATPLSEILHQLHVRQLILTGVTSHQCVLFTAIDAYVRDYTLQVPRDCIASLTPAQTRNALFLFRDALRAQVTNAAQIRVPAGRRRSA